MCTAIKAYVGDRNSSKPMGILENIRFFFNRHPWGAVYCFSLAMIFDHHGPLQFWFTLTTHALTPKIERVEVLQALQHGVEAGGAAVADVVHCVW